MARCLAVRPVRQENVTRTFRGLDRRCRSRALRATVPGKARPRPISKPAGLMRFWPGQLHAHKSHDPRPGCMAKAGRAAPKRLARRAVRLSERTADHDRRLPGCNRPERNPASHPTLRQGVLEALDRIPCPKPDGSEDAVPQGLRRSHQHQSRDRQIAEIHIRIGLMNRFPALGTVEIVRAACA